VLASARAHPIATVMTVIVSAIVIIHFWAYVALAAIGLAALKVCRARRR
jgi:hypothetical protein